MIAPAVVATLALLLLFFGYRKTIGGRAQERHRAWTMHWRIWLRLRPGPGFAGLTELWLRWGRPAVLSGGARARPTLTWRQRVRSPMTDLAVRVGRAQWGRQVYVRLQDQTLVLAPPQTGKSGLLADRILDHPGPVVCTSTRADLFTSTAGLRSQRGPIDTFNPLGIGDIPSTFGWNLIEGCDDPATAIRRAQDLTGDYEVGDLKWWQCKASAALAAMLHAAALDPAVTMMDVYAWVSGQGDREAEAILEDDPRAWPSFRAAFAELRPADRSSKTASSIRATISESLTWVAMPALAAAVTPAPGTGFDVARFLAECGTLYLIAPGTETAPIAPLFQAFVQNVHYEAGLVGSQSHSGRLDPPLWLALDELTQVCPLPLPAMLADSAGKGILITAVVHSYGQLVGRWGKSGAETVWATSGTKILLAGITDPVTLEQVSRVCGSIGLGDGTTAPVVPPELLRMLPKWRALVLSSAPRPVIVKTRPVWHRRDRWFRRPAAPVPALAAAPAPLHLTAIRDPAPIPVPVTAPLPQVAANGHAIRN